MLTDPKAEGFTKEEGKYAIDHLDVDWNQVAKKSAESYLKHQAFSQKGIYNQLISQYGENFTTSQAKYAIDHLKTNWNKMALKDAKRFKGNTRTEDIKRILKNSHYTDSEIDYAMKNLNQ
ncbi:Ltp family lipoprotein [Xylocopilactobacillus apicola]|uniref:Putative host cell surface-exposed lipoprotein Ltp-like HTH region domain-containing protein n=1 Tax=Xylocopilactobacillus apicola TaxID=2932184 RepID=A0AAU9D517_9LACO|nr:Ltp family lipoprotein [Xylocopilactobacillus apicola]BDR57581.1 hypothetical protein XA3_00220 [Xylocopilactobacillus apicola]